MSIRILSPELAKQIAAGEVVERPAAVVKELLENSLDAGADTIYIDINKAGSSLIKIRDNGKGIPKEELPLALATHATSKILTINDLNNLITMGFRGEALASISSISRFTLISRPKEQAEAWQISMDGRDDNSQEIIPAAHPEGTTVIVEDLFFNTPARRRFLASEKTEFQHIDETVKKIALAHSKLNIYLSHNGKKIREYRAATDAKQLQNRLSLICGSNFVTQALPVNYDFGEYSVNGWFNVGTVCREFGNYNYLYINNRPIKDKIISHAIKQIYTEYLPEIALPQTVLFINMPASEVDVNVHPTKAEVRFHQARLIHDFIYQALLNTLSLDYTTEIFQKEELSKSNYESIPITRNRSAAGSNIFNFGSQQRQQVAENIAQNSYFSLLEDSSKSENDILIETDSNLEQLNTELHSQYISLLEIIDNVVLFKQNQSLLIISLKDLHRIWFEQELLGKQKNLLIPVLLDITSNLKQPELWEQQQKLLKLLHIDYAYSGTKKIKILNAPIILYQQNLQQIVVKILSQSHVDFAKTLIMLSENKLQDTLLVKADILNMVHFLEQSIGDKWKEYLYPISLKELLPNDQ